MDYFGWLGSMLFIFCYVPQIWRTYRLKHVEGVSLGMWLIQWAAYTSCLAYSIAIQAKPLMFGYSIGWLMTAWFLELYRQYRR